jgi:hypothetical protein
MVPNVEAGVEHKSVAVVERVASQRHLVGAHRLGGPLDVQQARLVALGLDLVEARRHAA